MIKTKRDNQPLTRTKKLNLQLLKDMKDYVSSKILMVLFYEATFKSTAGSPLAIDKLREAKEFVSENP
jgi:hypothetical protein